MSEAAEKKHEHKGRSSREMLDARKILKDIGLKSGDQFLEGGCQGNTSSGEVSDCGV